MQYAPGVVFEARVAAAFRLLGFEVQHNVPLAGSHIDLLVTERTTSGSIIRTAVECKAYVRPVGIDVVNAFGAVAYLLRQRELVERVATIVPSSGGFTAEARSAAKQHGVELLEFGKLAATVGARAEEIEDEAKAYETEYEAAEKRATGPKRIFVLMPFTQELEDVYVLGIREVAERLGYVVERADDIEPNSDILKIILERIERADAVVAETSDRNPNVYYEVGYSHARGRPTVLLTRLGVEIPFDLRGVNHVIYSSIVDLRDRLAARLAETVG